MSSLALPLAALGAVLLDRLLGEPRRFHPLVGFGTLAGAIETRLNRCARPRGTSASRPGEGNKTPPPAEIPAPEGEEDTAQAEKKPAGSRPAGLLAWLLAVGPWVGLAGWLRGYAPFAVDVALLYFALGAQSLAEHAEAVRAPLAAGDLPEARRRVGWMVSRDTAALDATGVAKAGVESVLENGNDAVFGALFWFALLGGPGALLFRLANTLDAMWGYKTARFHAFGWAAARIDDLLNWPAARLTALTYAVQGRTARALACWRAQAPAWESPNAGPVMAAGAGSLGVSLGGTAIYHGREETRPRLGEGPPPAAADLGRAVALVRRGLLFWLAALFLVFGVPHA